MQSPRLVLSAAGASPWIPTNRLQSTFQIGFAVFLTAGATLTYSVQHTFDPMSQDFRPVSIARSAAVATVTEAGHTLRIGDNIIVVDRDSPVFTTGASGAEITAVGASTYQYAVPSSGATASGQNAKLQSFRVLNHSAVVAATADADGNYDFPVTAVRLIITSYTSGSATLILNQGAGRM
jgi:hypothetical protein